MNLKLWKLANPHRLGFSLLVLAVLQAAPGRADMAPYEAVYRVEFKGAYVADATFKLHQETADRYVFTSKTRARGLAKWFRREKPSEESVFAIVDGQITPQSYWFKDGTKKGTRDSRVSFDWEQGLATSAYEQETVSLTLDQPVLDRITLQLQVMHELQQGVSPTSYLLAYRNQLRRYDYSSEGQSPIQTRAGEFNAVGYAQQRQGSSRRTVLWMVPELGFLPVHMEQQRKGKTQLTFSLIKVSGLAVKPSAK
jgi:hypothetical protein